MASNPLIEKKILHAGRKNVHFPNGSKVVFHFMTKRCDEGGTILDDSRKIGKPMELILGKKFKLEAWESAVQTMAIGEVAQFKMDKSLLTSYPFVAKTLRDVHGNKKSAAPRHCCGMMALSQEGIGYPDLDKLMQVPEDLIFTIELVSVEAPEEYEKESWQLDEIEKLDSVPKLRETGNKLYKEHKYAEAAESYSQALTHLEQLMLREKPGESEWKDLDQMKTPLLLNFSQCKLIQEDYYAVIEHCTSVLEKDPDNAKALYRRGKAHVGAWNPKEAKTDFQHLLSLEPSLAATIHKELANLNKLEKEKDEEDKKKLQGKMFT